MGMANFMNPNAGAQGPQFQPPGVQAGAQPTAPTAAGGKVQCAKCSQMVPAGKFCQECGAALASPAKKFCTGCGSELGAAKFCANCGTAAPTA
jgi:hypothetical protein